MRDGGQQLHIDDRNYCVFSVHFAEGNAVFVDNLELPEGHVGEFGIFDGLEQKFDLLYQLLIIH